MDIVKNYDEVQELLAEQLVREKNLVLHFSEVNRYNNELLVK